MAFVPEGQADSSQARSAWSQEENSPVPAGRLIRSGLKLGASEKTSYHLLLSLPRTVPLAKAIQLIKAGSSAWMQQTFRQLDNFSWQQGYGSFSVSASQLPETIHCIQNQVDHHFDDKYLWA
jgi:hypothetical protein